MKIYVALAGFFLVLAYVAIVGLFYTDRFESDLGDKASALMTKTRGLENVRVEFQAFDAVLSGEVTSAELRQQAADLVAALPAARVVDNRISFPGFDPSLQADPPAKADTAEPAPPVDPYPAPPPPGGSELELTASDRAIIVSGSVPDITTKSTLLRAIGLAGHFDEIDARDLTIYPALKRTGWPASLPDFITGLLQSSDQVELRLDPDTFTLSAAAVDAIARENLERETGALDLGKRNLVVDLVETAPIAVETGAFHFHGNFANGSLTLDGVVASEDSRKRLAEIVATDFPEIEFADNRIAPGDDAEMPRWTPLLPNLLSLIGSRTEHARIAANASEFRIIAETKPDFSAGDLRDVIAIMIGPDTAVEIRIAPGIPPAPVAEGLKSAAEAESGGSGKE